MKNTSIKQRINKQLNLTFKLSKYWGTTVPLLFALFDSTVVDGRSTVADVVISLKVTVLKIYVAYKKSNHTNLSGQDNIYTYCKNKYNLIYRKKMNEE